jgi:hypothetical protein
VRFGRCGRLVTELAFSPDGRFSPRAGSIIVRVTARRRREVLRAPHRPVVNAIAWSADGTLLATATGSPADSLPAARLTRRVTSGTSGPPPARDVAT